MAYQVLARKWRPQIFEDVIGQEHVTETLKNAIKSERLAHAYLLSGPRGVGKTSVARILAKALNCQEEKSENPCNQCPSCKEITEGSSVDVQEIDGASNRGIDEIRELRENVKYMPSSGKYRIYIIDEVHMLTLPAFNALLKTLEEPPAHVKFIFATTELHKVPVTIISRCQRFDFKRIPAPLIVNHLERICAEEGIDISSVSLALIAKEADGSMRDAESLLDQVISYTGPKADDSHITEILGIFDQSIVLEASRAIIEGSEKACLEIVDRVYHYGHDIKEFYRILMGQLRNLLVSLISGQDHLLDMTDSDKKAVRTLAQKAGFEKLQFMLNFMITREENLRYTSHPRMVLETTMIKMCHLGDYFSFDDLFKKIASLENRLLQGATSDPLNAPENPGEPQGHTDPDTGTPDPRKPKPASPVKMDGDPSEESSLKGKRQWADFLKYLSSKNRGMYNILKDWRLVNLTESVLEIANGGQPFSTAYFEDKDRFEQLSKYCRQFLKRKVLIRILNNYGDPSGGPQPSKVSEEPEIPKKDISNLPPAAQDILRMFEGEIISNSQSDDMEAEKQKK